MKNKIKLKIRELLYKVLYLFGCYIEKKEVKKHWFDFHIESLKDAEIIHARLNKQSVSERKEKLKKIAYFIEVVNAQQLYSNILKQFVPALNFEGISTKFIGFGEGGGCLNSYRRVTIDNKTYFEKVYFSDSSDFFKMEWFYKNVFPLFNRQLKVAELFKVNKGDFLTVVYTEFLNLKPFPSQTIASNLFEISKRLYQLSNTNEGIKVISTAPNSITDYKIHFEYNKRKEQASQSALKLSKIPMDLKTMEKTIDSYPKVFTHADLHEANIFSENYIIDWDAFGIYPIGFETAFILFQLKIPSLTFEQLEEIIIKEYKNIIPPENWNKFRTSCLYFYFVFTVNNEATEEFIQLQTKILKVIL